MDDAAAPDRAFLVTLAVLILGVAAGMSVFNGITAHRWTHSLPVALLVVGAFVATHSPTSWPTSSAGGAALASAAVMAGISVQVWMGIPRSTNAMLDVTLLLVLLTPTAARHPVTVTQSSVCR